WIERFNIEYFVGVDGISMPLILLTTVLSFLAMLASWNIEKHVRGYCILFLLLETGMIGTFMALDFFLFYIFWEVMLLPMYFLIGIWGGPRREYAAIKFFLYTLLGSVFILIALLAFYFTDVRDFLPGKDLTTERNSFDLVALQKVGKAAANIMNNTEKPEEVALDALIAKTAPMSEVELGLFNFGTRAEHLALRQRYRGEVKPADLNAAVERLKQPFFSRPFQITMFLLLFVGFAIKVPLFPFHTWL